MEIWRRRHWDWYDRYEEYGDHSSSQRQDLYVGHDGGIEIVVVMGGGDCGDNDDSDDENDDAYTAVVCRFLLQRMSENCSVGGVGRGGVCRRQEP